ncbi:MAG: Cysteine desulfuration protein SufE [Phycisphaerae bacterium]|nr:Cysteine desulfuration protein SufE [Phycisphaerae bacterium]
MTQTANQTYDRVMGNLEILEDWPERYRYIIELGRKLPAMPADEKCEANRVHGCQSTVWVSARVVRSDPAVIEFDADSDSHIVRGLLAILHAAYNGRTPCEIREFDVEQSLSGLGLQSHLSPTRRNGLHEMVRRVKALACEYCPIPGCPDDIEPARR